MSQSNNVPHLIGNTALDEQTRLRLKDIRRTIWLTRPDLRELFKDDRTEFEWWLILHGTNEYKALEEFGITASEDLLTEPAEEALPQVRPALTRFMKAVWSLRPDLQSAFNLNAPEDQDGFVWWYFIHGAAENGFARFFTDSQRSQLNEPDIRVPGNILMPLTRLMVEIWRRRPDLQHAFDIRTPLGQEGFLAWYFINGLAEGGLIDVLDQSQAQVLLSGSVKAPRVPVILSLIWAADHALQIRFPDPADFSFLQWAKNNESQSAYPVLRRLGDLAGGLRPIRPGMFQAPANLPFGVNLIGYARGQLGIGEDVRMAALALSASGVPFSVYNVEPGREVCQGDNSLVSHISGDLPYAVNVFCMTGMETARLAAVHGSKLFDGRRSIGYWPWELPEWPECWHHAYGLVNEVWASSRFTYESYGRSCPKPVRHMPMAVTVDQTAGLTRRDFGLPENRFLFTFSFDFLSSLARKNPEACVQAFRIAFPHGNEPVGLVVKAMRATEDNPQWRKLAAQAKADGRITIISETLGRAELLDLYRACDCFVSLHRSEGFGRGIAEAMILGKPVIVTGHSGNMDFTVPGTAGLVDHRPRKVAQEDYPFGEGQIWAEPSIPHAALWMRRMAEDHVMRHRIAKAGQQLAAATYAPAVVGAAYAAMLGHAEAGHPLGSP